MNTTWFLIVNPTAGNANFNSLWNEIKITLEEQEIKYVYKKLHILHMK